MRAERAQTPERGARSSLRAGRWTAIAVTAILVAGIAAWSGVLGLGFVYDDHSLIEKSPSIRGLSRSVEILERPFGGAGETGFDYYRPLTTLSFALNYSLGGLDPRGFHLFNLVLHLVNGLLVFFVVQRLLGEFATALVAALLFEVHPIGVEAVAWVASRGDLLALGLCLAGVLFYLRAGDGGGGSRPVWLCAALGLALLAAFAKEHAVVFTGFLLASDAGRLPEDRLPSRADLARIFAPRAILYGAFVLMALAFIGARYWVTGGLLSRISADELETTSLLDLALPTRLLMAVVVLRTYLVLYLWPLPLSIDNALNFTPLVTSPLDFRFLESLVVIGVAVPICLWAMARSRAIRFGLLWFATGYVVVSGVLFAHSQQVAAERYLYIPSVGLAVALASVILAIVRYAPRVFRPSDRAGPTDGLAGAQGRHRVGPGTAATASLRWGAAAVIAIIVVLAIGRTRARVKDWTSDRTLFESVLAVTPESPIGLLNAGAARLREGDLASAESLFSRSARLHPNYYRPLLNLAQILTRTGRKPQAERLLHELTDRWPSGGAPYVLLGEIYLGEGRSDEAEAAYRKAVERLPSSANAHAGLARALAAGRRGEEAALEAKRATQLAPDNAGMHGSLGEVLLETGRVEEALAFLRRAVELEPSSPYLLNNLASADLRVGNLDEAEKVLQQASRLEPELSATHANLGLVLRRRGDLPGAERELRRAVAMNAGDLRTKLRLAQVLSKTGKSDEALALCDEVLRSDSTLTEARLARAEIHLGRSDLARAEDDLRQALGSDPSSPLVHYEMGVLLSRRGDMNGARAHLAKAAELDPSNAAFRSALEAAGAAPGR